MIALGIASGINGAAGKGVTGFVVVRLAGCRQEQHESQAAVSIHVLTGCCCCCCASTKNRTGYSINYNLTRATFCLSQHPLNTYRSTKTNNTFPSIENTLLATQSKLLPSSFSRLSRTNYNSIVCSDWKKGGDINFVISTSGTLIKFIIHVHKSAATVIYFIVILTFSTRISPIITKHIRFRIRFPFRIKHLLIYLYLVYTIVYLLFMKIMPFIW